MDGLYLRAKIPMWWIHAAAEAGKSRNSTGALHVGLEIWLQASLRRRFSGLKIPVNILAKKDFGRRYVRTALEVLENEGLIHVKRYRHQSPEITLVTSREKTRAPKPTPDVQHIIEVAAAVQDRDRLGRFVGGDHG